MPLTAARGTGLGAALPWPSALPSAAGRGARASAQVCGGVSPCVTVEKTLPQEPALTAVSEPPNESPIAASCQLVCFVAAVTPAGM